MNKPQDIFNLNYNKISNLEGWGQKSVNNLSSPINLSETNTVALGKVVYTDYFLLFQCAGIILLIAMIGSIVLTLRSRPDVKRQNITEQIFRDPNSSIEVKDINPGEGI